MELVLKADEIIGPVFPWELPEDFDEWFRRSSCGYLQLWGFWPALGEMCAVDVMIDRDMWE